MHSTAHRALNAIKPGATPVGLMSLAAAAFCQANRAPPSSKQALIASMYDMTPILARDYPGSEMAKIIEIFASTTSASTCLERLFYWRSFLLPSPYIHLHFNVFSNVLTLVTLLYQSLKSGGRSGRSADPSESQHYFASTTSTTST